MPQSLTLPRNGGSWGLPRFNNYCIDVYWLPWIWQLLGMVGSIPLFLHAHCWILSPWIASIKPDIMGRVSISLHQRHHLPVVYQTSRCSTIVSNTVNMSLSMFGFFGITSKPRFSHLGCSTMGATSIEFRQFHGFSSHISWHQRVIPPKKKKNANSNQLLSY